MFTPLGKTQNNLRGVASIPPPSCTLELKKQATVMRLFRLAKQQEVTLLVHHGFLYIS